MKHVLLAAAIATFGMAVHAADTDAIGSKLKAAFPQMPAIQSIAPSAIPGVFEVVLPGEVVYVDAQGEHMIQGHVIRLKDRSDLTAAKVEHINRIDFKTLPLDKALLHKHGRGERKMVVFADPNCGYCKKLEQESLSGLENVTVYTLPFAILSPDSVTKSKQVLCSEKPAEAWANLMVKGTPLPQVAAPQCEEAAQATLNSLKALGQKYGIRGTPTLIFEDGSRIPGFAPTADINARLTASKAAKN